mgnify:CR=1 FL=1
MKKRNKKKNRAQKYSRKRKRVHTPNKQNSLKAKQNIVENNSDAIHEMISNNKKKKKIDSNIVFTILSLVISFIGVFFTIKIANNTSDFENKNATLDIEFSKMSCDIVNNNLEISIKTKQGKIKKAYLADVDENDKIIYYKQDVIGNRDAVKINIPVNREEKYSDYKNYDFVDTKQFALVIFDYASNIYCYYVVFLAKPYIGGNVVYSNTIIDEDGNIADWCEKEIDNMDNWEDHSLIIDCTMINLDTINLYVKEFGFSYDYPLFKEKMNGKNGKMTSDPKLTCNYTVVNSNEIFNNIIKIGQDIDNSIN